MRALEKDVNKRPASAKEMKRALPEPPPDNRSGQSLSGSLASRRRPARATPSPGCRRNRRLCWAAMRRGALAAAFDGALEVGGAIQAGGVLDADDRAERAGGGKDQERRRRAGRGQHGGEDCRAADQESDRARRQGAQHDRAPASSAHGRPARRSTSSTAKTRELKPSGEPRRLSGRAPDRPENRRRPTRNRGPGAGVVAQLFAADFDRPGVGRTVR